MTILINDLFLVLLCCVACLSIHALNITTDEAALLSFKAHMNLDPDHVIARNWSLHTPVCSWVGVACNSRHERVAALDLGNMGIVGSIPPEIGNLSFLVSLAINSNSFYGTLPKELARLRRLTVMNFGENSFTGLLPSWFDLLPRLQYLILSNNSFTGEIAPSFGNMSRLQVLQIPFNHLQGEIPEEIGNLDKLEVLNLRSNQLTGPIPLHRFNKSSLTNLTLSDNELSGEFPAGMCDHLPKLKTLYLSTNRLSGQLLPLAHCKGLEEIVLSYNNFSGSIPREFGNLTMVNLMFLGENKLTGVLPEEIAKLPRLERLNAQLNHLSGSIPPGFFNISTLRLLGFPSNQLSGNLPSEIGYGLSNMQILYLALNYLEGPIPDSISNMSKLTALDLSANRFSGSIPDSLGNLMQLQTLDLNQNYLQSKGLSIISSLTKCRYLKELTLGANPLNDFLPPSMGNFSNLEILDASFCGLKGNIPEELGNLSSILILSLSHNELTGSLPEELGRLQTLQGIYFQSNKLNGTIPSGLCSLKNMNVLSLSHNNISGSLPGCLGNVASLRQIFLGFNRLSSGIPESLWRLRDIIYLNLTSNSLSGSLSPQISALQVVISIDLSQNQFSGDIPSSIGGMGSLINLSLAQNNLLGSIPESFGNLSSLEVLYLDSNKLSGGIPKSLEALHHLKHLNVSYNRLRGEIPTGGSFKNLTFESFISNGALCGASQFGVPPCRGDSSHRSRRRRVLLISLISTLVSLTILVSALAAVYLRRRRRKVPPEPEALPDITPGRIPYHELRRATDGFSESNLLGKGSFGSVYRGNFEDGKVFAVKVFNMDSEGAFKSFDTECEVLRNLRHRNLTKVIGSCCNLDFKALVLEYMPNGSLETWLYSENLLLDFLQRLSIMIDVAFALEYLHSGYPTPIVHCDLKPSNILLDGDMVGHVSDFGTAKLFGEEQSFTFTKNLATLGYIAPEYGMDGLVSTRCDVYSYGIILLEVFTRKSPSDQMFAADLSLRAWIEQSLQTGLSQVMDATLFAPEDELLDEKMICLSSIMEVALNCSAESPGERIKMKDVAVALNKSRIQFLAHL